MSKDDYQLKLEFLENTDLDFSEQIISDKGKMKNAEWQERLQSALKQVAIEYDLPVDSLVLRKNKKSYSICIYESELIEGKSNADKYTVIVGILEKFLKTEPDILKIEPKNEKMFYEYPIDAEYKESSKHIRINKDSEYLIPYLVSCVEYALDNYTSNAGSFACCARYEECSDEKKCTHPNRLYATACAYRKNLESGKIFYGKNKNIK